MTNFDNNASYTWAVASGNVTNFDANAFAFDTTGFANDLAGGYFFPAAGSLNVVFTNNHAPVASPASYPRVAGLTAKIPIADLLATWTSDADGDARELAGFDATSAKGASVTSDGTYLLYSGTGSEADSFGYTVRDVRTGPGVYPAWRHGPDGHRHDPAAAFGTDRTNP